ncbi:MAG: hypothetical protein C5B47_00280 [Verrucomicrobia bacterium]|nr:MAG: hypothetical protein C5B47_00280 [Verrucomicrobiota bacterium]
MISKTIFVLSWLIGILGAFIVNRPLLLLIGLLFMVTVLTVQKKLREFVRYTCVVLLPLAVVLGFIFGFVLRTDDIHSAENGILKAMFSVGRLALIGTMFLVLRASTGAFGNLRYKAYESAREPFFKIHFMNHRLPKEIGEVERSTLSRQTWACLFRLFGARRCGFTIVISFLNLWVDCSYQLKKAYYGRCARGLVSSCHVLVRLAQCPILIRNVFVSLLVDSLERMQNWNSNGLIIRLDYLYDDTSESEDHSLPVAIFLLLLSLIWTLSAALRLF